MELRTQATGSIFPSDVVDVEQHCYLPNMVRVDVKDTRGEVVNFVWTSEFAEMVGRALVVEAKRTRAASKSLK